ncbi:MAG: hypothetical protein U0231_04340 [Nitrospiraceae bacterium]
MAPDLLNLLDQRKQALTDTHKATTSRADQLDRRIKEMQNLVEGCPYPRPARAVLEAESKVREAHQKVEAARIAVTTAELNVDRHKQLAEQGAGVPAGLELTIQSAIASKELIYGERRPT